MNDVALRQGFRPEIQGLRAVAVLLVIAYHLYPDRVTGGYVGVDVFFVLSGYLITSHLLREAQATGGVALGRFWARRIRRLLPASLLVLAVATALTWLYIPTSLWEQTLRQIGASALYVENWALAADAVDYSAAANSPTLVQHYWSLSVEEQFYLLWPLLVLAAVLVARRKARVSTAGAVAVALGSVTALSFVYSVVATADDPAHAYFVTPTRAWEFGVGALVALLGHPAWWQGRSGARLVLGWLGLAAIAGAGLMLDDDTAFPGWIALVPVLGTAAVVLAGAGTSPMAASVPLSWRPMTFVGDVSYSMYLWHWPLIVVLPYVTGVDLRTADKAGIFAATVILSWACTRWVEDPVRTSPRLAGAPWRAFVLGAAGMVAVVGVVGAMQADLSRDLREARAASARAVQEAMANVVPCLGPAALADREDCGPVWGDGDPPPDVAAAANQNVDLHATFTECMSDLDVVEVRSCDLGARSGVRRTVAVVGDSHATALLTTFDELGRQRSWRVIGMTRASCPLSDARRTLPDEPAERYRLCREGNAQIERRLVDDPDIDTVFVTAYTSAYGWEQGAGTDFADPSTDGFRAVWRRLTDAGKQVVVIRDVPAVKDKMSAPVCLDAHPQDPLACAGPRAGVLVPDAQAAAVDGAPSGVRLIDLSDSFCDDDTCHVLVGDVIVYRDFSHLTTEYATLLTPYLGRAVAAVDEPLTR